MTTLLTMTGIAKSFGPTRALDGVDLQLHGGEVLALVGENGAGKSTLMKVLSGAVSPDAGSMSLDGSTYSPAGPQAARRAGVAMIYQELNLAPDLSVEDNIMLGREQHRYGVVSRSAQRARVAEALAQLGHGELHPTAVVRHLSVAARQLVEIARALVFEAKVVVFDEPTSSLPIDDVRRLFDVIARLRQAGLGVVYISHFLEEVRQVADRYVVLRDGRTAGGGPLADATDGQIVSQMVGRAVEELFPHVPHTPGEAILQLDGLTGQPIPHDVSFTLRRGEILGIAGLVGAGRTELLRAIMALDPVQRGTVHVAKFAPPHTPRDRIRAGLALVSEDRKAEGLAQQLSVADNLTLSRLSPYSWHGWLDLRRRRGAVGDWIRRLNIKTQGADQPVADLSGGNQQKVALARALHQHADVLLLDEPTRGIDLGAKADIYRLIGELAAQGKAVVFVSSYLPELLATCDRLGVMARGRLRELRPIDQWTEESVLTCALGGDLEAA